MISYRIEIKVFTQQLLLLMILAVGMVQAQTVNLGEMTITEGTTVSTLFAFENEATGRLVNDGDFYVYSHFKNDGTATYAGNPNAGMTRFVGETGVQQIAGTQIAELNHVVFDNKSSQYPFLLEGIVSIAGRGDFINGVIEAKDDDGMIIFKEGAVHEQTSDRSHVDGFVQKQGSKRFIFPVGDGGYYRFDGVSSLETERAVYNTRYFYEDPDPIFPRDNKEAGISAIDDSEYWVIKQVEGDGMVNLTLSWRDVTTPAFILGESNKKIQIAQWDVAKNAWINLGGEVDPVKQTVTAAAEVEATSAFTFALVQGSLTDLSIAKTSFEKMVWEGDDLEYEIRVQNNSETNATDVVVVDNLPPGTHYKEMKVTSAFGLLEYAFEVNGQTLMWSIPKFLAGDEMIITLTVATGEEGTLINAVKVNSIEEDANTEDNEDDDVNKVHKFFIPNVITPNGDKDNETFQIKGLNKFKENQITIFNRWGDHVFETENYQNDWEAKGLVDGTYFYVLEVVLENGEQKEFKGWIQVIRDPLNEDK
ncbi:gliding motility-associated C-terminal domain-containing protein [Echinicola vietnamensis]|uniref:Conserved repeat protein n=1 Tax=Echinicola vietnamensis (strain DSM 17526 / LMG 23754 / KMM 6221) TaxID=926556 RepID=L0FTW5_ECHVK|nr:gliding motility-associated C-terminal domain-containing protein [Echinicola vietnamensis]AGA76473.1 conserved repeat protein [Echinicola vietnamensis DSM 17526]